VPGTVSPIRARRPVTAAEVTAATLDAAHSRLLRAQAEALELAGAICRDLALKMRGATLPEVIPALPEPEQQSVRELYRTLADPVITPVGA
jgi:gamma-glutamyl phosphate reductase